MLTSVATVTLRILFFRAGPQDLPYAPSLTRPLIALALFAVFVLASVMMSAGLAVIYSVSAVFGLAVTTRALLRLRGLDNRYVQTLHALLLVSALMSLALTPPMIELMPELLKLARNPELLQQDPAVLGANPGTVLLFDALMVWGFAASARVYRQATDLSLLAGVLVSVLMSLSLMMFVGFVTSVLGTLLGLMPPAPN